MTKIITANKFQNNYKSYIGARSFASPCSNGEINEMLINFAKIHVQAALEEASEKVFMEEYGAGGDTITPSIRINKDSILNAYNLDNIK